MPETRLRRQPYRGRLRLEDEDVGCLGAAVRQVDRRAELGILALEIGFADPTGLSAAASDVDRDVVLDSRAHQVLEWW